MKISEFAAEKKRLPNLFTKKEQCSAELHVDVHVELPMNCMYN